MRVSVLRGTAKDLLSQALRATKLSIPARILFLRLPDMKAVSEALAWHFTDQLPYPSDPWIGDTRPLLHVCLEHAFSRAEAVFEKEAHPEPAEVTAAYMGGLFYVAHFCQHVKVATPDGVAWDPFKGQPLAEFLARNRDAVIDAAGTGQLFAMTATEARLALLARLVNGRTLAELGPQLRTVYEQETRE